MRNIFSTLSLLPTTNSTLHQDINEWKCYSDLKDRLHYFKIKIILCKNIIVYTHLYSLVGDSNKEF